MSHAKIELIYQEIANKFVKIIPVEWNKILLFSEVEEDANSIYYVFYESENNILKTSDSLTDEFGVGIKERIMYSVELSRLVEKLNKAFIEEGLEKWNLITFILENTGKFKIYFEYVNLEESDVTTRREAWEKKYL